MKNKAKHFRSESGQVSMITVAIFMMIFTILIVGFTYLAMNSMRQSTNDSISASASNAAESGVEDAKRMLRWCYGYYLGNGNYGSGTSFGSNEKNFCKTIIGKLEGATPDVACTDVLGRLNNTNTNIKNQFTLGPDGSGGYRVAVGSTGNGTIGSNEQYYQCLKIYTLSETYVGKLSGDGKSIVIPLRLVQADGKTPGVAKTVTIKWHKSAAATANGDGIISGLNKLGNYSGGSALPRKNNWLAAGNVPALLRIQSARVTRTGSADVATISNDSATAYLRPIRAYTSTVDLARYRSSVKLAGNGNTHFAYSGNDRAVNKNTSGGLNTSVVVSGCTDSAEYACTVKLNFSDGNFDTGSYEWYLRLSAIYKDTHFKVTATDSAGNPLYFDGVQPVVDVTGKSSDSYSRVKAHIEPVNDDYGDKTNWWPEYTVDTGGNVCKQIDVKYNKGTPHC